ncbi:uncharacterized protein E0L32_002138 [Thyridium curvatum]|uniref:Ankyrin n=1 Tax=Thyridium curvatum TaxID=1093900 RepID=A0A507AE80_9PEZI|nr:uncharacterized protein E0L32_001995 [Thyridium curvatum]XP_030989246.1 uncharacterized protein E0L32_002138 [Thyridium curvatum]TPX07392.1 hypothetical protein E0L32_001995 [Thyridium curvatum]TPX07535.1 hypothetical protein E0L32_002138 [Thyridium curvatum]
MLEKTDGEHRDQVLLSLLVNKVHIWKGSLDPEPFLEGFQEMERLGILPLLLEFQHMTARALVESMWNLAFTSRFTKATRSLLLGGVNPNGRVCIYPPCRVPVTPFQFSLLSGNLSMTNLLLDFVERVDQPYSGWMSSSIVLAVAGWAKRQSLVSRLRPQHQWDKRRIYRAVKLLITRGASLDICKLGIKLETTDDTDLLHYPLPDSQSPLQICARYHLHELVNVFLSTQSFSAEEVNKALDGTLRGWWTNHIISHSDDLRTQFPLATLSSLWRSGGDVNRRADVADGQTMSALEILVHETAWAKEAIDTLLSLGAKPTIDALTTCLRIGDYELFSRLVSLNPRHWIYHPKFAIVLRLVDRRALNWLLCSLYDIQCLEVKAEVLALISKTCHPLVWKELLSLRHDAVRILFDHNKLSDAKILSSIPVEILQRLFGVLTESDRSLCPIQPSFIHMSVMNENEQLAHRLIEYGFGMDEVVEVGGIPDTALCAAIRNGATEVVNKLLIRGAKTEVEAGSCACGHVRQVNALVAAAECHDMALMGKLVQNGANINSFGVFRRHPRFSWKLRNQGYLTSTLAGLGGDPCQCCTTPLAVALVSEDWQFVQAVVGLGANPNNPPEPAHASTHHLSPLAALFCTFTDGEPFKLQAARLLLDAGADPRDAPAIMSNVADVSESDLSALLLLLERSASTAVSAASTPRSDYAAAAALVQAIRLMNPGLVGRLLERQMSGVTSTSKSTFPCPFFLAVSDRLLLVGEPLPTVRTTIVSLLSDHGNVPNPVSLGWGGKKILLLSHALGLSGKVEQDLKISNQGRDMFHVLLDRMKSPMDQDLKQCLFISATVDSTSKAVQSLYEKGLEPQRRPTKFLDVLDSIWSGHGHQISSNVALVVEDAVQMAALQGNIEVVKILLMNGAMADRPGNTANGATALQLTLLRRNNEVARLLISHGADINAPHCSTAGRTCLQIAAATGDLDMVKLLVRKGADVNAKPPQRRSSVWKSGAVSALQHAVRSGSLDVVRYLVEHDADINLEAGPFAGATALQYAATEGGTGIAEYLLRHGANVMAEPAANHGITALEAAAEGGRIDLVYLLLGELNKYLVDHREWIEQDCRRACRRAEYFGHFAVRDLIMEHFGDFDYGNVEAYDLSYLCWAEWSEDWFDDDEVEYYELNREIWEPDELEGSDMEDSDMEASDMEESDMEDARLENSIMEVTGVEELQADDLDNPDVSDLESSQHMDIDTSNVPVGVASGESITLQAGTGGVDHMQQSPESWDMVVNEALLNYEIVRSVYE